MLNPPNEKSLIIVRDCIFNKIRCENFYYLIEIKDSITFYMTSCLFDSCYFNNSALYLRSRGTTISHICCNNLYGGQKYSPLFLKADLSFDTFFKLIYSTFFGNDQFITSESILKIRRYIPLRYQCINVSNFILDDDIDRFITKIESATCLTMQMNTFYHIDSGYIVYINVQNGNSDQQKINYFGLANFFNNQQRKGIINIDFNIGSSIIIDQCYFSNFNTGSGEKIIKFSGSSNALISNCFFETYLNNDELIGYETINCHEHIDNFQTMILAHYTVKSKCDAIYAMDAFGCKNDTCPDNNGCKTFSFGVNDVFLYRKISFRY